jgi:hypothetical protein
MSANIYWEPVSTKAKTLRVMAPSSFISAMERADLPLPNTFGESAIPTLRGMAATMRDENNPFTELIEKIEKYGPVTVWYQH